jgi:hypothetical protein
MAMARLWTAARLTRRRNQTACAVALEAWRLESVCENEMAPLIGSLKWTPPCDVAAQVPVPLLLIIAKK